MGSISRDVEDKSLEFVYVEETFVDNFLADIYLRLGVVDL